MTTEQPATRYRRRYDDEEISAMQWTGSNAAALSVFAPDRFATQALEDRIDPEDDAIVLIEESHWVAIRPGEWVLKYPDHFDVEADEAFRATSEPVVSAGVAPATDQTAPSHRAGLRDALADAIREAVCTGDCGTSEEECAKSRIQPFVWHHGVLAGVEGSPEQFVDAVLPVLYREWPWLRAEAEEAAVLPASVDRKAVLEEAADAVRDGDLGPRGGMSRDYENGWWNSRAAAEDRVRRLVDETPRPTADDVRHMLTRMRANAASTSLTDLLRLLAVWASSSEGRDVLIDDLIAAGYRLPHACGDCGGVDPDTCLMNPDRPPEQCPAAEFEDYGQQCTKAAGHNLHSFEEQAAATPPAGGAPQPKETDGDRVVAYRSPLPGALSIYCTRHTDELGNGVLPLTSDDLPDGGVCAGCGADVLIPQQPREARP